MPLELIGYFILEKEEFSSLSLMVLIFIAICLFISSPLSFLYAFLGPFTFKYKNFILLLWIFPFLHSSSFLLRLLLSGYWHIYLPHVLDFIFYFQHFLFTFLPRRISQSIIPVSGISLAVQWLRLHYSMQGVQVQPLVGELRSHMPCG